MATKTQTRKLYNDEVTLYFNPDARNRYQLQDGTAPVGVTTILSKVLAKEALMLWPMNMATGWLRDNCLDKVLTEIHIEEARRAYVKKSDKGKDVGTEVHEAIEAYLKAHNTPGITDLYVPTNEAGKAYQSFCKWFESQNIKVLATEQIVYSRSGNYAGTFDTLLQIDGQTVLCDVKTTNISQSAPQGIYPEYFLQLGAYSKAHKEENHSDIDDLMIINASKSGVLSTLRASDLGLTVRDCENAFNAVLYCYRFLEPLKKLIKERV